MNYKPIELQVALPRTVDAGTHLHANTQKIIQEQPIAAKELDKQIQHNLEASEESHPDEQVGDRREGHHSENAATKRDSTAKEAQSEHDAAHPYKGKHVDISL